MNAAFSFAPAWTRFAVDTSKEPLRASTSRTARFYLTQPTLAGNRRQVFANVNASSEAVLSRKFSQRLPSNSSLTSRISRRLKPSLGKSERRGNRRGGAWEWFNFFTRSQFEQANTGCFGDGFGPRLPSGVLRPCSS